MKTNHTKADANRKEMKGEMKAKLDSQLEKMGACHGFGGTSRRNRVRGGA
jgi:hypothetical protein